jgi:LysR family hydrogen peroxide-inducible transcriptional activator
VNNERNVLTGDFKQGVIPTIASYLVPELLRFIQQSQTGINRLMQGKYLLM